jgi:hypothetical protein
MQFTREAEMLNPVLSWVHSQGLDALTEFPTSWGICDVVAAAPHKGHVRSRAKLRQRHPITTAPKIDLLMRLPDEDSGQAITLVRILKEAASKYGSESVEKAISELSRDGYIVWPRKNHLQKRNGWIPMHRRLVAIEMKLRRVEEALIQAYCNLRFASESYVALPAKSAQRVVQSGRVKDFEFRGVGLISVSRDSCYLLQRSKPDGNVVDAGAQILYTERFLRIWLKDS